MPVSVNIALRNASVDAIAAQFANGKLDVYDGAMPADADTAIGAQVLLASATLPAPAFATAAGGVAAKSGSWSDQVINASGTAAWFRITDSGGTVILQGNLTATGGGGDMTVDDVNFTADGVFTVTSFSLGQDAV